MEFICNVSLDFNPFQSEDFSEFMENVGKSISHELLWICFHEVLASKEDAGSSRWQFILTAKRLK